jgi:hypothetical protein
MAIRLVVLDGHPLVRYAPTQLAEASDDLEWSAARPPPPPDAALGRTALAFGSRLRPLNRDPVEDGSMRPPT